MTPCRIDATIPLQLANIGLGKYYSVNVPLTDGITDESYNQVFRPLMTAIMERYQPGAVVVQCGMLALCYQHALHLAMCTDRVQSYH